MKVRKEGTLIEKEDIMDDPYEIEIKDEMEAQREKIDKEISKKATNYAKQCKRNQLCRVEALVFIRLTMNRDQCAAFHWVRPFAVQNFCFTVISCEVRHHSHRQGSLPQIRR